MNFRDAADIAKQNPGATLTRNASGSFIVRLVDGKIIESCHPIPPDEQDSLRKEIEWLRQMCDELKDANETTGYRYANQASELEQLRTEVEVLKEQLAKVSPKEWARIDATEKVARDNRRRTDRDRIMSLIRQGSLSTDRLLLVKDSASQLGLSIDEIAEIDSALEAGRRNAEKSFSNDSFGVYGTTDGQ